VFDLVTKKPSVAAKAKALAAEPVPITPPPGVAAPTPAISPQVGQEFSKLLGEVCWLMSRVAHRRHMFMADLEWLVMPALALGQARLYRNDKGDPISFVSWATVSDEVNERLKSGVARLAPPEWRSGPHLWVFDLLTPFGGAKETLDMLNKTVFDGKSVAVLPLGGKPLAEVLAGGK
jgi:cytolysin-activating lysine-acyltransferase